MIIYHVGIALDTLVLVFRSFFEGALEPEARSKLEKLVVSESTVWLGG